MRTVYYANDGTEFDDYDECEAYETGREYTEKIKYSLFWDLNKNPMTVEEWLENPDECDYMSIASIEEARLIRQYLSQDWGLGHPWLEQDICKGKFFYSHLDDEWHNFDEEFIEMIKIQKVFEG